MQLLFGEHDFVLFFSGLDNITPCAVADSLTAALEVVVMTTTQSKRVPLMYTKQHAH